MSPKNSVAPNQAGRVVTRPGRRSHLPVLFFPARMDAFSRRWLERRAEGMATDPRQRGGAGLEFDDPAAVQELLKGVLARASWSTRWSSGAERYGARRPTTTSGAPRSQAPAPKARRSPPIPAISCGSRRRSRGARGASGVPQPRLHARRAEEGEALAGHGGRWVSLVVFLVGLAASFLIGTVLVRPGARDDRRWRCASRAAICRNRSCGVGGRDEVGPDGRGVQSDAALAARAGRARRRAHRPGRSHRAASTWRAGRRRLQPDGRGPARMVRQIAETSIAARLGGGGDLRRGAAAGGGLDAAGGGVEEVSRTMQSLLDSGVAHRRLDRAACSSNAERTKQTTDVTSERVAEPRQSHQSHRRGARGHPRHRRSQRSAGAQRVARGDARR